MNHTDILKAAKAITSGDKPAVTAKQLEDALLSLGDLRKLLDDRDPTAQLLTQALDIARTAEQNELVGSAERRTAKARLHKSATDQLDDFVAKHRRPGESDAQATARLSNQPGFVAIWSQLRAVQDL